MDLSKGALKKDADNWHCFTLYKASARHPELRSIFSKKGVRIDNIYALLAMLVQSGGRQRDFRTSHWRVDRVEWYANITRYHMTLGN